MTYVLPLTQAGTRLSSRLITLITALLGIGLLAPLVGVAQAPTITTLAPTRNLRNAPAAANVAVTFSQPMQNTTATQRAVRVFSQQRGGRMFGSTRGVASVSGNTITFNPTNDFKPGETLLVTTTTAATATNGSALAAGKVHQFTATVGGTGQGNFIAPATNPEAAVGTKPMSVALGDVDGDGDLDALTANYTPNTVSVRLNNGSGGFTAPATNPEVAVGTLPYAVVLADVDGDGDLDFLAGGLTSFAVSVRLNNGSGSFTAPATNPEVSIANGALSLAVGDVDGDGDLDLLAANYGANSVSVRFNNGSGNFSGGSDPAVGSNPNGIAVGDVDGDGDLDIVTSNFIGSTASVRLNNGSGTFTAPATNPNPAVGSNPAGIALGDVDADGDLDMLVSNQANATVSVRLNNGSGNFTAPATNPEVTVGGSPQKVALGDVDADGDLDFVTASFGNNTASVRLNNGSGNFTAPASNPDPAVGQFPRSAALGDVDGDGDLDMLVANDGSNSLSVRLNQLAPPTITSFTPSSGPVGTSITITGTNLSSASAARVNGTAGTITANTATSLTFTVAAGNTTGLVSVVTPLGTATSATTFTVIQPPTITSFTPSSGPGGTSVTITGTNLTGATAARVNGTVGTITANTATSLTFVVAGGSTTGAVSVTTAMGTATSSSNFTVSAGDIQCTDATPLATPYASNNSNKGEMFDIVATNTVTISCFDVSLIPGSNGNYQIYYKTGSYVGSESNPAAWTLLGSNPSVPSLGFDMPSPMLIPISVTIPAGQTAAFYITATDNAATTGVRYTNNSGITVLATNPDLLIRSGVGKAYPFGVTFNNRSFNGTVRYYTGPPPTITSFTPTSGPVGTSVTVTGTNLSAVTAARVNGTAGTIVGTPTATSVTFTVGAGSTTGALSVTTPGGTATGSTFTIAPPTITSFTPSVGPVGTSITITGTNLTGATAARVNGTAGTITANTATSLTFTVGAGSTSGTLSVTTGGGTATSAATFTVVDPPTITSFTPGSGPVGASITITGTNLTGATFARVNGTAGTITANTATSLTFTVAAGSTTGAVSVTTVAGTATGSTFTVIQPPTINNLVPFVVPEGATVTVWGTNFTGATAVAFNGVNTTFTVLSATQITATIPVGATSGPVTVTNPAGTGTSAPAYFRLLPIYGGPAATVNTCQGTISVISTGTGTWQYMRAWDGDGFQLVLAINDQGTALGLINADFYLNQGALRTDRRGTEYFDRNWRLTAANAFVGHQVRVRFYARNAEFANYVAANDGDNSDVTALNQLRLVQYSAPTEDCLIANNAPGPGREIRVLTPVAVEALSGANWFALETVVSDHFSEFFIQGGMEITLPVELTAFTARRQTAHVVDLNWQTASEKHNRGFIVQRSPDGRTFTAVSELIAGHGTSATPNAYTWTDRNAPAAVTYFRLQQLDTDGTATYSDVVAVAGLSTFAAPPAALGITPNPAAGSPAVRITGGVASAPVTVVDATGRRVASAMADATGAAEVNTQGLAPGVYLVRVADGRTARLVVE